MGGAGAGAGLSWDTQSCHQSGMGGWQQTKTCPQIKDMSNATKDNQLVPAQDYYLNKTKGFYCLRHLGCLKDGKGHKDFSSLFGQDLQDKLAVRSIFCH